MEEISPEAAVEPLPTEFCEKLATYRARGTCFELTDRGDDYELRQFFVYYDETLMKVDDMGEHILQANEGVEKWGGAETPEEQREVYFETYWNTITYLEKFEDTVESINSFQHFMYMRKDFCSEIGMDPGQVGPALDGVKVELKANLKYYRVNLQAMGRECELTEEEQEKLDEIVKRIKVLEGRGG